MHNANYEVEASSSHLKFEFFSLGPKGKIKKRIVFTRTENNSKFYNLGFGDVDSNGWINDEVITDNKDSKVVLATVALTLYNFFENYPNTYVFAKGGTKSRTRLYQMGISNNLSMIVQDFDVYGRCNNKWEVFRKNRTYEAFLVKKKIRKLV